MPGRSLKVVNFALALVVLFSLTACGSENAATVSNIVDANPAGLPGGTAGEAYGSPAEAASTAGLPVNGFVSGVPPAMSEGAYNGVVGDTRFMPTPGAVATGPSEASGMHFNMGSMASSQYQSPLTAGQVDDNEKFDEYLDYLHRSKWIDAMRMAVEQRMFVRVTDGAQKPIVGARVQLFDGNTQVFDGRTMSDGRALFFPREAGVPQVQNLRAVVTRGQHQAEAILPASKLEHTVAMKSVNNTGPVGLDIVFLMDATGSMADELAQLTATVGSIASRIEGLPGSSKPRLGLVAYRDEGDEYVTRSWDFTQDVQQFSANLARVIAADGGDYPEAVNAGLREAIHLPGWADANDGRRLRLIILVGDAPPHLDYPNDHKYPQLLQEAVAAGIKVFPIGASGLDDQGEYIFRQFAQVTQGKFIFLTYANGVSGQPGPATTHHVSDFTVRNLDSLIVSLVAKEVANQTGPAQGYIAPNYVSSVVPSIGLLARVADLAQSTFDYLLNLGVGFWLAVVLAGCIWVQQRSQRARVAAMPLALTAGQLEEPQGEEQDRLAAGTGHRDWDLEADEPQRKVLGSTLQVAAPYQDSTYEDSTMGQPTTPLRAIPIKRRNN